MSLVHRYEEDTRRPTPGQARSDLVHRTLRPAGVLWLAILSAGWLIVGPLDSLPAENEINEELVDERTAVMNDITLVWSNIGGTHFLIGACLVVVGVLWWRTRHWWVAIIPAIALSLQSVVFTTSSFLIGRRRPDVEHLDVSPPTSGFPSGHTGASTAFYLTLALLAQRIRRPALRWTVTALCVAVPLLVGFARMYRGMHFLSDVIAGLINGIVCSWLAWRYLRRDERRIAGGGGAHVGPADPQAVGPDGGEPERVSASAVTRSGASVTRSGDPVTPGRAARAPGHSPRTHRTRGP